MSNPMATPEQDRSLAADIQPAPIDKAIVIGLYGIPGCGKSFLLKSLKSELNKEHFSFYEGSEMIASIVPGGLDAFQLLQEEEQTHWRHLAIDTIGKQSAENGKAAIVTGHFMFWSEGQETGKTVYTTNDLSIFTHVLYLNIPVEVVARRRLHDKDKERPLTSASHLQRWQQAERDQLRDLCYNHSILFLTLAPHLNNLGQITMLLRDFKRHTECYNLSQAERELDRFVSQYEEQPKLCLIMDADKTLAAQDTGILFWEKASRLSSSRDEHALAEVFSSPMGYSFTAFRQAALLYEELADDQGFESVCKDVASEVTMYPDMLSLLQVAAKQKHIVIIVVTCGLRLVWDKVLDREGLSDAVAVIGAGRLANNMVITAEVKGALITRLRDFHHMYVMAFGDSPLDLDMLIKANDAVIVVGEDQSRSKSMDVALADAFNNGLRARQAVLAPRASLRLDTARLPLIRLSDPEFASSITGASDRSSDLQFLHATHKPSAKLLMSPMRDATHAGVLLREDHRRVGWYLATEFLADAIGLEEYPMMHVQGHYTTGHRLLHEKQTLLVALMRGGESMAFGINDIFPLAMFLHAGSAEDIKPHHLHEQITVVLVDSVVNRGQTVSQFVHHIRNLHATIRIVVVAGVVQADAIQRGVFAQELAHDPNLSIVALRCSDNKFVGTGTTDTGNRLFNTTHLS